jgi:hypothetical protein
VSASNPNGNDDPLVRIGRLAAQLDAAKKSAETTARAVERTKQTAERLKRAVRPRRSATPKKRARSRR